MLELLLLSLLFVLFGLAAEKLEVLLTIFVLLLVELVREEDAVLAALDPWGLRHRCIDLLQVEL